MQLRTIPLKIKKKVNHKNKKNNKPDSKVVVLNICGKQTLVSVLNEAEMQKDLIPHELMMRVYEVSKKKDLEIEE